MSSNGNGTGADYGQPKIALELKATFSQLFGINQDEIDAHTSFLDLGADSLSLLRVSQILQEKFNVKVPFRSLLEELSSIAELAAFIAKENPLLAQAEEQANGHATESVPDPIVNHAPENGHTQKPEITVAPASIDLPAGGDALTRILSQQMQLLAEQVQQQSRIMSAQLELLKAARGGASTTPRTSSNGKSQPVKAEPETPAKTSSSQPFVAYHPVKKDKQRGLTTQQQQHLDNLIEQVTARTKESKRLTQTYRPFLADSRSSAGFRQTWKEMCYPLVVARGEGSRVHDVDGNEYVDLTMGFGALLFGHSPDFLVNALQEAVADGVRLGGQSNLAGETAKLFCEMTGNERVAFCNSGTEAVMSALRLARTVTGRTKIAVFEGCYHGTFDGVMVRPGESAGDGSFEAIPLAPGVPQHMVDNVLLLGYDDAAALEVIRKHAHELAAVLIEPPRSRHPDVQPKAFLHELRKITEESGAALIFDEVVTGFRFHPGGVQSLFEVQADLVCYGKAMGGGVPVAVVAGKAKFMDATDGGMWNYGDASYPRAETTFFAGTYFKNPLIVSAVWACLNHIKDSGPKLYEELNGRTTRLAQTLNDYFNEAQVPMRVTHLGSLLRFLLPAELKLIELFYYHLLAKGVYICETRNCFLSTAHTDADVERIVAAVKETIADLRAGGIIPDPTTDSPNGDGPAKYNFQDPFGNLATSFSTAAAATAGASVVSSRSMPLTEGQKQLWFLAQMGGESSVAYNLSVTMEMRGSFDSAAMCQCLQAVVDNHEALRITISPEGDQQHVLSSLKLDVPLIELPATSASDGHVTAMLEEEAKKPFDLANGPLIRACLVKLADQNHLVVLTTHHIVTDGWSLGVIVRELSVRYNAACEGAGCALPHAVQFGDYVAAELAQREKDGLQSSENYWLEQFKDTLAPLELPIDFKRPLVQSYAGARAQMTIDLDLCTRLEQYGAQHSSTLFMLLLASFNLLLHRLSRQDDIVVGIPAAGQAALGNSLVGYCVNVLPLRSRLAKSVTIDDYLKSVKRTLLDAYDNQFYPFGALVKKLKLTRDPSRSPLVSVMFNLDRAASKPQFFGVETELLQNETGSAQFELDLNITRTEDRLQLECDFNTSLFSRETIERWLGHFRTLLTGLVENETNSVYELPLLNDADRRQLLQAWNDTQTDFTQNESFLQLFEKQVERTPNAVAAVCGDQVLTYAELNDRADHLGRQLVNCGAGPERIVALLADRSVELLVSILAVFKTGGAYLPLDPRHPAPRIAQVLQESGAPFVVATKPFTTLVQQVQDKLSAQTTARFLVFETLVQQPATNETLPTAHAPESLAYVIYTSGSTGVPKGAMVTQRGMLNHLLAKISDLQITASDAIAQNASQCFDISVWQFLAALPVGGRVHIFNDEIALDSAKLLAHTSHGKLTILQTVPSLLRAIVESDDWSKSDLDLSALRHVVVTGEAVAPDICNRWLDRYSQIPLLNAYGPTECSDDVTHHQITEKLEAVNVPIGKPLANTQLYVVDPFGQPLPIGIAGELLVGGEGVGRGYLARPELTAEKFIPDSFSQRSGARLYRTGDLARFLPDGTIDFLGRIDHQVKVRGHRIELGEIEAALGRHPSIRQAVAVAREDVPGDKRLVAYLVSDEELSVGELRSYLKEQLPEYMIPSVFVTLTELPLTANGKVDRRALPAPQQNRPQLQREYTAPRTELEQSLVEIWSDVLRVEQVGIHDNFFELGGDSILSIQIISRARQVGLELTALDMFQHQSIAELIAAASSRKTKAQAESTPDVASVHDYLSAGTRETITQTSLDITKIEDAYPLSPTQQGMLFHHLFAPASTAYFEQVSWSLHGELDVAALQRAWTGVIEVHPILRTSFAWESLDEPLQLVQRRAECSFEQHDWREVSSDQQPTRLESYLEADRDRGFDLVTPPLRFTLIRLTDETWQFIWSYHHILLDGWAIMLVLKDVFDRYEAYRQGNEFVSQPARPFREYISWLSRQDLSQAEAYWRRTLAGFSAPTPLGVDKSPGGQIAQAEEFAQQEVLLSPEATTSLKTLARQNHLTMSTLILGAWGLLLSKYSGHDDVVFGTVGSGRPPEIEGVEEMVGLFINTLPARVQIDREMPVIEWLKQLQEQQAEARQYEYSPLVQVQGWSDVPRGLPLFESIVAFENYPVHTSLAEQRSSLESRNVRAVERVNYPLFLVVGPGAGLSITVYYDGRRFDAATIERMQGHFQTLLEKMVDDPSQHLAALSLMNEAERRRLLFDWNDTATTYPYETCVHQLFEQQAARTPQAIALAFEGQELTYAELDEKANGLSRTLRALNVGPDSLVGLFMDRSPEMVIALLGVWKAGGAYVPLDPQYPRERIAYMMQDAGLSVLLTQQKLRESLPVEVSVPVVCVDDNEEIENSQNSESTVTANNLAYVIYTSGSTGNPKGVEIPHRALANFLFAMREVIGITPSDTLLAVTSLSFDIAGLEIFLPLTTGAKVEFASRRDTNDATRLIKLLQDSRASIMQATPTAWELLLNLGWRNNSGLKVLCGGEAMPAGLASRLVEDEDARVWNLYGPTETTIWSTSQQMESGKSISIGRPIANTQIYILDKFHEPAPIGIAGDLFIGGDGVARSYLSRPELTAEKFIPDCFSEQPGARLYRTGDLARYLPDGRIEFLGRLDHQVKLHGHRIELGEIEAVLDRHAGIRQAVVVAREDVPGDKRLVAYLVVAESTEVNVTELRRYLKDQLPEYQIPAVFVTLPELPLTANGKVDRRALPAPEQNRPDLEREYVAPRTAVEQQLSAIWSDVLRVDRVGIHDSFFELGGDSILTIQVISRARQAGLRISPAQLFEHPTIAELSTLIPAGAQALAQAAGGEVPLTPIQQWFFKQNLPEPNHFNQAALLEIPANLDAALIGNAVAELFARHDALRLRFTNENNQWQQTVSEKSEVPFSIHDLSTLAGSEQSAAIEKLADEIQRTLDLSAGPIGRLALMKLGDDRSNRLLIVVHHLVVDFSSWRIMLEDFVRVCEQLSRQEKVELPPTTTSFAAWTRELNHFAQSAELDVEANYWRQVVERETATLALDHNGENTEDSAAAVFSTFTTEETRSLLHDMPKTFRVLPSEVVLTALARAYAELDHNKSLLVELEGHGRESIRDGLDLSRTVGWFTSLYPVRLDVATANDSVAALKLVKEQVRSVPRGGIGFGALKYLNLQTEAAQVLQIAPRAEISFNYIGEQEVSVARANAIGLAPEKCGSLQSKRNPRPYQLMVTAEIRKGQLTINWSYSKNLHQETTIQRLAQSFERAFKTLIDFDQKNNAALYTPSDFPNANLSQLELDEFLSGIGA